MVLSVMVKLQPRVSPVCGHDCRVQAKAEAVRCFLWKCLKRNWCDFFFGLSMLLPQLFVATSVVVF